MIRMFLIFSMCVVPFVTTIVVEPGEQPDINRLDQFPSALDAKAGQQTHCGDPENQGKAHTPSL